MSWWLWALLGVLALAGEAASMALFLLNVGIAAFVVAVLSAFGLGLAVQVAVFVALAVLLIGVLRPRLLHTLTPRVPQRVLTNQGRLLDRLATVTQPVTADSGMVRLGAAEFWTARANPPARRIEVGTTVRIVYVSGLTAYVEPVNAETPAAPAVSAGKERAPEES